MQNQFDDLRLLLSQGSTDKRSLYHAIQRLPQNERMLPVAVRSILLKDERSLEVLKNVIETLRTDRRHRRRLRKLAVRRLGEFSDYQLEIAAYLK